MTPKQKALDLQKRYNGFNDPYHAISMALICVDEILEVAPVFYDNINIHASEIKAKETSYEYWLEVKQELEKL